MNDLFAVIDRVTWALASLSLVLAVTSALRPGRIVRTLAGGSLIVAALLLAGALALPAWLPAGSAITYPDGSTGDPRVMSALLVGLASLAAFMQGLRALRIPPLGQLGFWLPGIVIGGLVAFGGNLAGLHVSVALAGLALGGLVIGTAVVMAVRHRSDHVLVSVALQAASMALVVIAAMLSIHGARAERLRLDEGASVDTLGTRVTYVATQAPHDSLRRVQFAIGSSSGIDTLWAELRGRVGTKQKSLAAARVGGGPALVPRALQERRTHPHEVTWIKKGESVASGTAQVKFEKFRFVMGDTIRLFADLEVTQGGRVRKASPGAIASSKGEIPFSSVVEGYGPIAIAGIDADNARVGLVLPGVSSAGVVRTAEVDLRLRPGIPLAWIGAALGLLAFLFTLGQTGAERPAHLEH